MYSPPPADLPAPINPNGSSVPVVVEPVRVDAHADVAEADADADADAVVTALDEGDSGSHTSTADHELELASVSTETEDDPVNRAMRAALDDEDGDENEFGDQYETETMYQPAVPAPDVGETRNAWPEPMARRDTVTAPAQ